MFCFFFQAEDGIRDLTVTGVQTCALPISARSLHKSSPTGRGRRIPPRWSRRTGRAPSSARPSLPDRCRHARSEEHTSELQSQSNLVCRLLLEKKKKKKKKLKQQYTSQTDT